MKYREDLNKLYDGAYRQGVASGIALSIVFILIVSAMVLIYLSFADA